MSEAFKTLVEQGGQAASRGDYEAAETAYHGALTLMPGNAPVASALGMIRLMQGRYAEGWPLYEGRKAVEKTMIDGAGIPEWRGESLQGRRLLIWPEQGLGDEIQLSRYIPLLKPMAGQVLLVCAPSLARLFAQFDVAVGPLNDGLQVPPVHYHVRNFSLPLLMGTTLETIPPAPYLTAPSDPKTGGVGFVWRGDPTHPNDANRSLPSPDVLAPLRDVAELIDLQQPRGDFLDTAARIQALDLVITVDTSMAHLAGALGVPCWVMLPARGLDWRWMQGRSDSPWYPSLRLYRQRAAGDWSEVVQEMRRDLIAARGG